MLKHIATKIFGTKHERDMKKLMPLVHKINGLEPKFEGYSDADLAKESQKFKERIKNGESLNDILPEAFAVCREASKRVLGMRHYDVQMIGGIVLHSGRIAEMKTGEGKTLVATLPVYLNSLSGKGAHVVTVNDYLAKRDAEWMGRVYKFLGQSVGIVTHEHSDRQRKDAYNCDITYATNNELGFDYLRDNMKYSLDEYVQREHSFAIVDECDSILIDEARTPLIISGPAESSTEKYGIVDKIVPHLENEKHFTIDEKAKSASLTDEGNTKAEELLKIENLYDPKNIDLLHHIYQALKAHHLYKLDADYMIQDGEVVIVDEFTGRPQPGRRWSDGLHQAIEAKEKVKVKNENQTLASITYQNYFRMYDKLSGMTGTADTEAVEFKKIYNLDVNVIPTNKPIQRIDNNDSIYKTELAKYKAIAEDINERHQRGQPILVGTVTIEKSEKLSQFLNKLGVKHNTLNAKHHEREAEYVAQAGRKGTVTIATNMAGRGTDIVLGGNPEAMAQSVAPEEDSPEYKEALQKFSRQCEEEKKQVLEAGGLHIVGTERHESRRIDNQLRGRSGRQGDPGSSRFYLSLEDSLMRIFAGERLQKWMDRLNHPDDEPIEARMISKSIEGAQRRVEGHNFDIRKQLIDYDDVMNQQRKTIYSLRREILEGEKIDDIIREYLGDVTSHLLDLHAPESAKPQEWDLEGLEKALTQQFGIVSKLGLTNGSLNSDGLNEKMKELIGGAFEAQKSRLGHLYDQVKKMILLQTIDGKWKDHLQSIDHLREGIHLRGFAQKDPLVEYKKEAFAAFEQVDMSIKSESLEKLFKIQIVAERAGELEEDLGYGEMDHFEMSGGEEVDGFSGLTPQQQGFSQGGSMPGPMGGPPPRQRSVEPYVRTEEKVGRNDPCPCGSGKKYKKCHGKNG